ncbi:hypothetical protein [Halosimplex pelagicum]|uniref:Uncharacterized protein n=1 Tax=Halosimplex pelagicum TaxID=869886 RepID=A0A7D5TBU8_9EURY|nr:hypothetical protein [Halosimplex pelagicum]QLH82437.1 hypothetical protein HZS54_12785 [Halosimplex pelagicum]QLH82493.1 hypothetical protein HZS54_13090 [Halosimplex pelagicum]
MTTDADDGQPAHDLDALADAIERVLLEDEYDYQLTAGPYEVHERRISRSGATIRQVVVDYDGAQSWLVLPEEFAEVVVDVIQDRDGDGPVAMTDSGQTISEPSSREQVRDRMEKQSFIKSIEPCGPGLRFTYQGPGDLTFTNLIETQRWYLANFNQDAERGVIMPVPERDEGGDR